MRALAALVWCGLMLLKLDVANGHGILLIPPARSSAWREDPSRFPVYYGDNQMFCGGVNTQWGLNNGKCGICGDPYSGPKLFEKGGEFYRGYIVRTYSANQKIDTVVEITANHKGYFEFRLCNVDNLPGGEATQNCLDQTVLRDAQGRTQIPVTGASASKFLQSLIIPPGFTCNHCVLQWRYNTGNSWGLDSRTGQGCIGCGKQEQFYGCSDIRIIGSQKREMNIDAPSDDGSSSLYPIKKSDENEHAMVSKSLLKRLFNELRRLKTFERELVDKNEDKREEIARPYESVEQDTVGSGDLYVNARDYLPQEVQDLELRESADSPQFFRRLIK